MRPLHRKLDSKIEEELLNHSECTLLTGACSVCLQLTHIERLDDLLGKFLGAVTRVNIEEGHREDVQRLYTLICNTQTQAYIGMCEKSSREGSVLSLFNQRFLSKLS